MIPVFVDGALPDELATSAILLACTQVVKPSACVLASRETAVGRVLWENPLRADIDVANGTFREHRTIEFQPVDLPEARWQAVGLIVGSLLQDAQSSARSASPIPPATPQPPDPRLIVTQANVPLAATQRPPPTSSRGSKTQIEAEQFKTPATTEAWRDLHLSAGLGGLAGFGLTRSSGDIGPARLGGWAQLEARAWKGLGLTSTVRVAWLASDVSGVNGRWSSVDVGPSFAQPLGTRVTLLFRTAASREELRLKFEVHGESRAYWCWRVGVGLEGRLTQAVTLTGQFELAGSPEQSVRVAGIEVANNPAMAPAGLFGARTQFF